MFYKLWLNLMGAERLNKYYDEDKITDLYISYKRYLNNRLKMLFKKGLDEAFNISTFKKDLVCKCFDYIIDSDITLEILDSNYFKTMPTNYKLDFIRMYSLPSRVAKAIIDGVDDKDFELVSTDTLSVILVDYPELELEERLTKHENLPVYISAFDLFSFQTSKRELSKLKQLLSKEDFIELCIKGEISCSTIFDELISEEAKDLDSLVSIMLNKKDFSEPVIRVGTGERVSCYVQFLGLIKSKEEWFTSEERQYLIGKIIATKKYSRMFEWVSVIYWDEDKTMIDVIYDKSTEYCMLSSVDNKFVPYIIKKYLNGPQKNKFGIDILESIFSIPYELEKTECILSSIYAIKPDAKFSKEVTISLLKEGVSYFPKLITSYELSKEERSEIVESLRENGLNDLCLCYGAYLLSGDKTKILPEEMVLKLKNNVKPE